MLDAPTHAITDRYNWAEYVRALTLAADHFLRTRPLDSDKWEERHALGIELLHEAAAVSLKVKLQAEHAIELLDKDART